ncbi:hypothetical protein [Streptomyces sp. CC224B]|uniref:hypothetical protein n=1 Tax=Streptomyces sp. CC224B TaxID=3044571 RepID=UPI0024A96E87|nr:hypothetical protein [Streptomyces sp. CC224B]
MSPRTEPRPQARLGALAREMDHDAAERSADAAERDPQGPTAVPGFAERAAAADDAHDDTYDDE